MYDGGGGAGENYWLEKVNIMPDSIEGPTFAFLPNLLTIVLPSRTVKIGKEVFGMNRNLISVSAFLLNRSSDLESSAKI